MPKIITPVLIAVVLSLPSITAGANTGGHNTLTPRERQQGWQLLYDGKTLNGWSLYRSRLGRIVTALRFWRKTPEMGGWVVDKAGNLQRRARGGDLKTNRRYGNFELKLEWKISTAGNSGVFLRTIENNEAFNTGIEMQVLDNAGHSDGKKLLTSAGALYALYPAPSAGFAKGAGRWNAVHIIVTDKHIQFYLNGHKTVNALIGSDDWNQRKAAAPLRISANKHFGRYPNGHIVLQDHGDDVWYRNIKIREI